MEQESPGLGPPYGPVSNLRDIFDTWRDRSMPEQVNREWLERIGISSHLTAKNLHALRFLGLIDEEGYTTSVASRVRVASSEEYPSVLEEIVRKAYRFVFEIRNPTEDSRLRIEDAFRRVEPQAQRPRMVALFLGLCQLALIPLKEAPAGRLQRERGRSTAPRKSKLSAPSPEPTPNSTETTVRIEVPRSRLRADTVVLHAFDPILAGLLNALPEIQDEVELDNWYTVFKSAFALVRNLAAKNSTEDGA
jgi:hypothetical protein